MKNKNVVVTGGAGYCGSRLVPQLLDMGYSVTVFDTFWFGQEFLPTDNPGLKLVEGDIRDTNLLKRVFTNHSTVINLACISNDASFELDESLSTSVNLEAFEPMVIAAKKSGVRSVFKHNKGSGVLGGSLIRLPIETELPYPEETMCGDCANLGFFLLFFLS